MSVTNERIEKMLKAWKRCLLQCEDYVETAEDGSYSLSDELLKDYPDFNDRWAQIEKERDAILREIRDYRLEKELEPVCCTPEEYFFAHYNSYVSPETIRDVLSEIEEERALAVAMERYEESAYLYD